MHIPLWATIVHAARYNGVSLVQRTNSENICLPGQLQAAVPACALSCLRSFVANNYGNHNCSSTANLNLLCTTKTSSGLTIGEGSLQCVISSCLGENLETQSGYTVCEGISGALPNMAGTITATISVLSTLTPSTETTLAASTATTTTEPEPTTSSLVSGTLASSTLTASFTTSTLLITSTSSSSPILTTDIPSTTSTSATTTSMSSFVSSITSIVASSSASTATNTERSTLTSVTTSHTSSSSVGSAPLTTATVVPVKQQLNTSAIAGIATACVIVAALLAVYFAYWFCVKRRAKHKRRSQRLSVLFPPHTSNDKSEPSAEAALRGTSQVGSLPNPNRRFYSGETYQQKTPSFWRSSFLPPSNIGVAVAPSTNTSPEGSKDVSASNQTTSRPPPVSPLLQEHEARFSGTQQPGESRWSIATSFDEDLEAQNQDVPVLASPKTRSLSRSIPSTRVKRPAPLKLLTRTQTDTPPLVRIPLTPTYDNGNYEPTIRQVIDGDTQPADTKHLQDAHALNFSWRSPLLVRRSQEESRPVTIQHQQGLNETRFPVRPIPTLRKPSTATETSIHTEIEEDVTPEQEEDKELTSPSKQSSILRTPLRDLQWPQIPRSAATRKQAVKTPSPRAALTIRNFSPSMDVAASPSAATVHEQADRKDLRSTRPCASTTESCSENAEPSMVTTPSVRNPARPSENVLLGKQHSDVYQAAPRSTPMRMPIKASIPIMQRPESRAQPIQRLATGRPLAVKMHAQGYMPRPLLVRSASRARVIPMTSRSGDLYLSVGNMDN